MQRKTKSMERADLLREKLNAAEEAGALRATIVGLMSPKMLELTKHLGVDPVEWAQEYVKLVEIGWLKPFDK